MNPNQQRDHVTKPGQDLNLKHGLETEHQTYNQRLTAVLEECYEGVWWVLGDDLFHELCHFYIEGHNSVPYHLSEFGVGFPEFLGMQKASRGIPFLQDLAQFEWAYKEILIADTPRPLSPDDAESLLRKEDYQIQLITALEIFSSEYSVSELWRQRRGPAYVFEEINWSRPENLLIYKKDRQVHVDKISPIEAKILKELRDGATITMALADFSESLSTEQIKDFFKLLAQSGIVEDILVRDEGF